MIQNSGQGLVSPSDIADIAGVSRGAVSNWRKRIKDFPKPTDGTPSKPLFSRQEVIAWLESRGHTLKQDAGETGVWAVLNQLRDRLSADDAAALVLSLAVARKTGNPPADEVRNVPTEARAWLRDALDRVDVSDLGAAADFVLERLAKAQVKVGAENGFVGSRTATMLANLAVSRFPNVLYDPACGIASALLEAVEFGARPVRLVGHDINERALWLAAKRAELHGIGVELIPTDVLSEDIDPGLRADVIILEPPFGVKHYEPAHLTDARFEFGAPPRSSADTAWLQHAIAHLSDDGRAYVLSPAGALFRGGQEGRIRTELVRRGCVEAIVGLPGKMLPHTSIPLALWVLRRPDSKPEHVLLIDASESVAPESHVASWLKDSSARDAVPHVDVPITDVLAADSVLAPNRWVDRTEPEPGEITNTYEHGWAEINATMRELTNVLASFEHHVSFQKSRVMTIGELVEQGVLEVRQGRPKDQYEDAPEALLDRIATAADVRDGTLRKTGLEGEYDQYSELTREGDVLVTTMHTVRARVDDTGGHLPSTGVHRLRIIGRDALTPAYLAIALTGSWNERFQGGTTIQRAPIKELEVPLVPTADQHNIQLAVNQMKRIQDQAEHVASSARAVQAAVLDAVRYNAPLPGQASTVRGSGNDGHKYTEGAK